MPTSGQVFSFSQQIPVIADKSFLANTLSSSFYKSFNENVVGASKIYLSSINGLGDDDVRLSKRKGISQKDLGGLKKIKLDL